MEKWTADECLVHHGILGMRWGKRNGPPYPLEPGDHSASEKKAGWRKSLDGGSAPSVKKKKRALTEEQKSQRRKNIARGAGVALGAALAAGAVADGVQSNYKPLKDFGEGPEASDEIKKANADMIARNKYLELTGQNKDPIKETIGDVGNLGSQIEKMKNNIKVDQNREPEYKRMNLDDVSDQDLRNAINRENLEIQYSKMFGEKVEHVKTGEEKVRDFLEVAGTVTAAAGSALTIALLIKRLAEKSGKAAKVAAKAAT